jgi:hypothetical protein
MINRRIFSPDSEVASLNSGKKTAEAQRITEDTEDMNDGNGNIKGCAIESSL